MSTDNIISGNTSEEVWQQLDAELAKEDLLDYNAVIKHGEHNIQLSIDNDPGGGFESGIQSTVFSSPIQSSNPFRFAIHKEGFLDEIGKFFGMQDVLTGYPAFDKHVVVKTNDEEKVKQLFSDETTTSFFQSLTDDFTFGISTHHHQPVLEFSTDIAITDSAMLRKIYQAFYNVLTALEKL